MKKRVFVSYSRRNKTFAERLARDLSDAGLDVWIDFRQIQGGELWQNEIYRGISRSEIVVFCMSPDSVVSEWCQREVLSAKEQGKYIVPVMVFNAMDALAQIPEMKWLLDVHFINFEGRYEAAIPDLLEALPGARSIGVYDDVAPENIPNPFKGLEAFQQTDAPFFFGREELVTRALSRISDERRSRFVAVVGASGSGKSSLVRAGVIPKIRAGELPESDEWPVAIFTPGANPVEALATRLLPLLLDNHTLTDIETFLHEPESLNRFTEEILRDKPTSARLLLVVDQFEELFTRAGESERETFLRALHHAVTVANGRTSVIITMRADFFGQISPYPQLAEMFEQENMIIVTQMTPANLLRAIEGPAQAVGLVYEDGLSTRILEDIRRQPGSLPLLQYALTQMFERREGRNLTWKAYETIGGVQRALARHAETIYSRLNPDQQNLFRRLMLRLVEVSETGEATRRRVSRDELTFRGILDETVQELIDLLTAAESRLLIASREIKSSAIDEAEAAPTIWIEVSHEALIREWDKFKGWIAENVEALRLGSEVLKAANDWERANRDVAYLLTGNRLAHAEIWLETADATNLQRQFIESSIAERQRRETARAAQQARELELQRRSTNRLRYFVGVLVVSLFVAVILILFAVDRSAQADQAAQREREAAALAAQREAEARSLALSASADRALADGNSDLALALAVEAVQIPNAPSQAQFTLANVSYAPGVRRRFEGHTGIVHAVAYSPDGQSALSGAADNSLILWNLHTGEIIHRMTGHFAPVRAIAFSPDGKLAVSGSQDATLILWNIETGEVIHHMSLDGDGHIGHIRSVAFSPDGTRILSGSIDKTALIWEVATGTHSAPFTAHKDAVIAVAFSPDGRFAVTGSRDEQLIMWDASTLAVERNFSSPTSDVLPSSMVSIAFAPDGLRLFSATADGDITEWDVSTGVQISTFRAIDADSEQVGVSAVAFSPDASIALTGGDDSLIGVWDIATAAELIEFSTGIGVISGAHNGQVTALAFSYDNRSILSGGSDNAVVQWDIQRSEQIRIFPLEGNNSVASVAYSPDGRSVLSGSSIGTLSGQSVQSLLNARTGDLRSWDVDTGRIFQQFSGHRSPVSSVAYSPDGEQVLSGDDSGVLILWNAHDGTAIRRFGVEGRAHTDGINAAAFTPDGTRALSGSRDGTLSLWNVESGAIIGSPFIGHAGAVFTLAISPDGQTALSGSADNTIILWNLNTGTEIRRYDKHEKDVRAVAFSPDGLSAASGASDGSLIVWTVETGRDIAVFRGHRSAVNSVAFSPDGLAVLSGSLDGTISLWEISSGFEVRRYPVNAGVLSLAFSPDGLSVVSGLTRTQNTFRLWRILPTGKQLLDWTFANRFVPQLECFQREQFRLTPPCEGNVLPVSTPYPLPTATPISDINRLVIGRDATVNTTLGERLNVRNQASLNATIAARLERGDTVTLLEGPVFADSLNWWRIRSSGGAEGWVVESIDNIQTLRP